MTPVDPSPLPELRPTFQPKREGAVHLEVVPSLQQDGFVLTEWELSDEDRWRLLKGERIRAWLRTEGAVPPILLEVTDSDTT